MTTHSEDIKILDDIELEDIVGGGATKKKAAKKKVSRKKPARKKANAYGHNRIEATSNGGAQPTVPEHAIVKGQGLS